MPALSALTAEYRRRLTRAPQLASVRMSDLHVPEVPFDQGSAQKSFHPSLNGSTKPYQEITGGSRYPQRASVIAVARALQPGGKFSLIGNAPHLRRLEYGWSGQRPAGFSRIAVAQWQPVVDEAVRGVLRGT